MGRSHKRHGTALRGEQGVPNSDRPISAGGRDILVVALVEPYLNLPLLLQHSILGLRV